MSHIMTTEKQEVSHFDEELLKGILGNSKLFIGG
jgi:hypothetical protein